MRLTFYRGETTNFGDELNVHLWPLVLGPEFLDDDPSALFVGIGSILWDSYPAEARKIVVGAGYGGYTSAPDVHDGSWDISFVRGPRTAAVLGLPASAAVTDGAVLVRTIDLPAPIAPGTTYFMPHFDSLRRGLWHDVCALAGVELLDPTGPVDEILARMRGARLIVTEAMHGAIVADALRVPWVAVRPIHRRHRAKWLDWSESLDLELRMHSIFPSSVREAWSLVTGGEGTGPFVTAFGGRVAAPAHLVTKVVAANNLRRLLAVEPQLSDDAVIGRATDQALERVRAVTTRRHLAVPARRSLASGWRPAQMATPLLGDLAPA